MVQCHHSGLYNLRRWVNEKRVRFGLTCRARSCARARAIKLPSLSTTGRKKKIKTGEVYELDQNINIAFLLIQLEGSLTRLFIIHDGGHDRLDEKIGKIHSVVSVDAEANEETSDPRTRLRRITPVRHFSSRSWIFSVPFPFSICLPRAPRRSRIETFAGPDNQAINIRPYS